jgi:hypothetical protein
MYNKEKIMNLLEDIVVTSKEIAPYVVIAQPRRCKEEMPAQKFNGRQGMGEEHVDIHGFSHGFCDIYGEKVDVARNYLIEQVIESDAKYMFFIGEDTVVPYHAFKTLHKTAEENPNSIAVGVYYIKLGDAMIMVKENNWIIVPNVDPGQVFPVHMCGMDCMLIPVEILRKMKEEEPELPFCCIANGIPNIPFIGEDNFFMHRVHKMGVKILCNTDVQCLHMDISNGKYTAHPNLNMADYHTNIKVTERLTEQDREYIDKRWHERIPKGSNTEENK